MDIRPIDAHVLAKVACAYPEFMTMISASPVLSLNALRDAIYQDAVEHGLWNENDEPTVCSWLVKQEAMELDDAASEWADYGWTRDEPDDAFVEELADVMILCMSTAGHLGIDIDAAIRRKMEINKNRPWKHGKE